MTKRKKTAPGKGKVRSLKLKKQTLKDLDAKGKSRAVRGGAVAGTIIVCTAIYSSCPKACGAVNI